MQGNILSQTGGSTKINGIIEEYKVASGGNVNTGDFVKFVNSEYGTNTQLFSSSGNISTHIASTQIDINKIFILHCYESSNNCKLYGVVCTIDGTTITVGTITELSTYVDLTGISLVNIDTNKIFIVYRNDTSLYSAICTIDETVITVGTSTIISLSGETTLLSAIQLDANKVFITYGDNSSNLYTYGVICIVDGTTITVEKNTRLIQRADSAMRISSGKISDNKVILLYRYNGKLYGVVCTIDETTITVGTTTELSTYGSNVVPAVVQLDINKILIILSGNNQDNILCGIICKIQELTITLFTNTVLILNERIYNISATLIDNNKVFISYRDNQKIYGLDCRIDKTNIVVIENTLLCSENRLSNIEMSICRIDKNKAFIVHLDGEFFYGIVNIIEVINKSTGLNKLLGIAKTKGIAGQTVKVIVPKEGEN